MEMEEVLVVANWKENKTVEEAREWLERASSKFKVQNSKLEVVLCPSFVVLPMMAYEVSKLEGVKLGAQDVSKFEEGPYTGEVSARQLSDFVNYVIVGHSERRRHFGETNEDVNLKIEQCLKYNLTPIVCVSRMEQVSQCRGVTVSRKAIFAYEPLFAIGTGKPDTPENASDFAQKIKAEVGQETKVLYGGSVTSENVKLFVGQPEIDGVLVGQASLDAKEFARICYEIYRS